MAAKKLGAFDYVAYIFIVLVLVFLGSAILWLTVEMWRMILDP